MEIKRVDSLNTEYLYGQLLYPVAPLSWLAPLWSFTCGVIASTAWTWTVSSVLRLFLGLLLVGPLLGTVWGAIARVKQCAKPFNSLADNAVSKPAFALPYTLSNSPSYRLSIRLSLLSQWWQEAESLVSRPLVQLATSTIFALTVAAELGWQSLVLTALGLVAAYTTGFSRRQWAFHPVFSISAPLFLDWLLGHVAFAALHPVSIVIALAFALVFCGCFISSQTGQGLAWQVVPQVAAAAILITYGQPVFAAVITLLASPQLLLSQLLGEPKRHGLYFQAVQWQLAFSMFLAAFALGYRP